MFIVINYFIIYIVIYIYIYLMKMVFRMLAFRSNACITTLSTLIAARHCSNDADLSFALLSKSTSNFSSFFRDFL